MKSLAVDEINIAYVETGSGEPLVLLHNGGDTHAIWLLQIEELKKKYHVFAFDLIGFGASSRPEQLWTLEMHVDFLEKVAAKLGLQKIHLAGNCIGSTISLEWQRRYPERIKSVFATNVCGGRPMMPWSLRVSMALFDFPFIGPVAWRFFTLALRSSWVRKRVLASTWYKVPPKNNPVWSALEENSRNPKQNLARRNLMLILPSFDRWFSGYKLPSNVTLCWGENNKVLTLAHGRAFAVKCGIQNLNTIPKSGHLPMAETPAEYRRLLEKHLQTKAV